MSRDLNPYAASGLPAEEEQRKGPKRPRLWPVVFALLWPVVCVPWFLFAADAWHRLDYPHYPLVSVAIFIAGACVSVGVSLGLLGWAFFAEPQRMTVADFALLLVLALLVMASNLAALVASGLTADWLAGSYLH